MVDSKSPAGTPEHVDDRDDDTTIFYEGCAGRASASSGGVGAAVRTTRVPLGQDKR